MKRLSLFLLVVSLGACAPSNEPDCMECRNWKVIQVKENDLVVYSTNGPSLYPAYADFKFNLLNDDRKVIYRDIIGAEFTGNWGINPEKTKLMINNLEPLLYGAQTELIFDIISMTENLLVLKNTTTNPKTGDTINEYTLTPI